MQDEAEQVYVGQVENKKLCYAVRVKASLPYNHRPTPFAICNFISSIKIATNIKPKHVEELQ